MRFVAASLTTLCSACALCGTVVAARPPAHPLLAVGYTSDRDLAGAVRGGRATIVRRIRALRVAEVRPNVAAFAKLARRMPGIRYVQQETPRISHSEPAVSATSGSAPYEWQFAAAHEDNVPPPVLRAAGSVTVAVIDTGADLTAPDLAAKSPSTYDLASGSSDVPDANGHGTFVASLAAGSVLNGEGVAGFGGDARLLIVKAGRDDGTMTDLDEANGIVYAVNHGARVINLSVGGPTTSFTEGRGVEYAAQHGVLIVASIGNEYRQGNPVEYPAALLQPVGSNGRGGIGLSVGASTAAGSRAFFSNIGSQLSLVAPGENVLGALSSLSSPDEYPRAPLPGSAAGLFGFASGTSFSAPEVAGAAALVMGANPFLQATEVAEILEQTASGHGSWNQETGFGVLDAEAAVSRAQGSSGVVVTAARSSGRLNLRWFGAAAVRYRVSLRVDRGRTRVLLRDTTRTSVSVALRRRHRYVFTIAALDATGSVSGTSTYGIRG